MIQKTTLTIFLLLSVLFSFAQDKYIQIEMVDQTPTIGAFQGAPTYYYDVPFGATDYSNDAGLNAILAGNNVIAYDVIESLPNVSTNGFAHWTLVVCDNCDNNQLATDLSAYSSVIRNAYPLNDNREAYNQLYLKIADINIGTPTGVTNGIITTNDAGLNAIFTTHTVYFYQQSFPSSSQNSLLRAYTLLCDCDAALLKTDLDAYTSVIEVAERTFIESQLLSTTEAVFTDVNIYPNPVKDKLNISKTENITSVEIYSIQGKRMRTQKSQFETIDMSQLKSGLYFVTLTDNANRSNTFKIVKK
ncbi:T9SS type A sorting domain-containing protein [Kordia jejudonensis]|uniref:T9SS type A sorting domain-containing protein n=1 Tax=Kordia jejudonensis TaxID=1348245 RepID=UPI0006292336|nr:T9SS type A sorting domain-containing protein [Kordia jejudonensis]